MTNQGKTMIRCLAIAIGAALLQPVQAQEVVLKSSQVTEAALIEALALEAPEAPSGATRGFRPVNKPKASAPTAPGKANLLITFLTNSAELTPESQVAVDTLARALQSDALAGFVFRVEGHADARGDAMHNQKLSELRAESVARYMVDRHGVLPERLIAQGKGSSEPLNKARVDAPENRRVTIVTIRE